MPSHDEHPPLSLEEQLRDAAASNNTALVKDLLDMGALTDEVVTEDGTTAVICAVYYNNIEMLGLLLQRGADVNAKKHADGWTALLEAARRGYTQVLSWLIDFGADLNARDKDGLSPLMAAAYHGHLDIVQALLRCGADINARKHKDGFTALMVALSTDHDHIVNFLVSRGASIQTKSHDGTVTVDSLANTFEKARAVRHGKAQLDYIQSQRPVSVPGPPNLLLIEPGRCCLTVSFAPPIHKEGNSGTILGYVIRVQPGWREVFTRDSPCTITGLVIGQEYEVSVLAVNEAGRGGWSKDSVEAGLGAVTPFATTQTKESCRDAAAQGAVKAQPLLDGSPPLYIPLDNLLLLNIDGSRVAPGRFTRSCLGRGAFSFIYLVEYRNLRYAYKDVPGDFELEREIELMKDLRHPHIMPLYSIVLSNDGSRQQERGYLMDVADEDLFVYMKRCWEKGLPLVARLAKEIASGLAYLHSHSIIHRDLHIKNVLMIGNRAVISDFNRGKRTGEELSLIYGGMVALTPPEFRGPEGQKITQVHGSYDLYGYGLLVAQLVVAVVATHAVGPEGTNGKEIDGEDWESLQNDDSYFAGLVDQALDACADKKGTDLSRTIGSIIEDCVRKITRPTAQEVIGRL